MKGSTSSLDASYVAARAPGAVTFFILALSSACTRNNGTSLHIYLIDPAEMKGFKKGRAFIHPIPSKRRAFTAISWLALTNGYTGRCPFCFIRH